MLYALAVLFFAAASGYALLLWRRGFTRDDWWCYALLACGFVPNTGALMARGFSLQKCPVGNLFEAAMFLSWALVLCHLVAGLWPRVRFLCAMSAPLLLLIGVFGLQPALDRPGPAFAVQPGLVSLHASLILLAYGTFGLSAAAGLLYLMQERNLKMHRVRAVLARLPSIERLERTVALSLMAGLALLSAGLMLTVWLVRQADTTMVRGDPKVIWSFAVWLGYATLLALRFRRQWGPRPVAWGALVSFAFVMLTFWGTNMLSPTHH